MQITPGTGGLYCGNCLRDNALVMALRQLGHQVVMVPLYLALTLDEEDQSSGAPLFFGGLNVYLEQKSALFRKAPGWVHKALNAPGLLKFVAGRAVKTRPEAAGELTLSMLRGEEGRQAREVEELCGWLKANARPDALCLFERVAGRPGAAIEKGIGRAGGLHVARRRCFSGCAA